MFRNYLTTAYRNLLKNKSYAMINIAGLSLGLTSAFLIFALVRYHFNIDQHHSKADRIFRVTSQFKSPDGGEDGNTPGVPYPFGTAVKNDYPQIEQLAMIEEQYDPMVLIEENGKRTKFKASNDAERGAFVEPSFFKMFDYKWLAGNEAEIKNPNTVVISKKYADKLYNTTDCIGKIIKYDGRLSLKIVGVFQDYEDNTDFPFQIMPSYASLKEFYGGELNKSFNSTNSSSQCFVLLNDKFTQADWNKAMPNFTKKYIDHEPEKRKFLMTYLLDSHFSKEIGNVNKNLVLSLLLIGIFLIATACINFVNLATAQALKRSKEVGVRKVMGSTKTQLFWQFMAETAIITITATLISIALFYLAQPFIHTLLSGIFKFTFYFNPLLLLYLIGIIAFVILFSGAYPAIVLAGFQPVMALKGKISTHQLGGVNIRKGLVVLQFAISQMLIIGLAVVTSQLSYFQNKDLGFKKEAIITVGLPFTPKQDLIKMNTFKNLASGISGIESFSYSMSGPPQSGWVNTTSLQFDNRPKEEDFGVDIKYIDDKYLKLFGIEIVAGRNILPADSAREFIFNETLVKKLGFKNPSEVLGKTIKWKNQNLPIVGVIKDFHMQRLSQKINPLFMTSRMENAYNANIKLGPSNAQNTIKALEVAYEKVYPESYFEVEFVDDQLKRAYDDENTMGKLINFFALVAILIGCLGLFGLVSFMANQKTKEIGIRKVLGASVGNILGLFGKEFGKLILIAFVIAAPLAWYIMNSWLQDYEYRTPIGAGIFVLAIVVTLLIAGLTVGYRSLKAAIANPVKSLKTE
jgi:putative ABC transport system permease protein